jgi:cytochrome c-type biogenesis protein CcmE|tara:strand:- start:382 stop:846 length:465 start_codon:yes stop_codon:yes gene_type:complete
MHPVRRQRLFIVLFIVVGASVAAGLIFYALSENLNLFYSPTQINDGEAPQNQRMRAGGMVREGSVIRAGDSLKISFVVTDYAHDVNVNYEGILPDMFEEGQGVVVTGKLDEGGVMQAEEVLAKHDEEYMPPEVQEALDNAKESGKPASAYKGNY